MLLIGLLCFTMHRPVVWHRDSGPGGIEIDGVGPGGIEIDSAYDDNGDEERGMPAAFPMVS